MVRLLSLAALAAAAVVASASSGPRSAAELSSEWYASNPLMSGLRAAWQGAHKLVGSKHPRVTVAHFLEHADQALQAAWAEVPGDAKARAQEQAVQPLPFTPPNPLPGPYWRWVPVFLGETGRGAMKFSSPCFASNVATSSFNSEGNLVLSVTASNPVNSSCSDAYLLGTAEWLNLMSFSGSGGTKTATFPVTQRVGARAWAQTHGVRVMRFLDPEPVTLLWEVIATVSLFVPALTAMEVDPASAQRNYDFIQGYANITMPVRSVSNVTVDPSLIGTGDVLVIHRPDGLGTLEQWGTGAPTTHTTTFMRTEATNELMVCESQSAGADWPIDRIQCNPWDAWQAIAQKNSYSYVWMPLTAAARASFNNTAAWAFINSTLGVNYGFQEFASTFYDTEFDNLPWPARPEELEVIISILEGLLDPFISMEDTPLVNLLFTQATVQHLGLTNFSMGILEALQVIDQRNSTWGRVMAIPEQDTWLYPEATGKGPTAIVRVCNAYVCAIQKAAGLFGDLAASINCADTHNLDVETFPTLDPAPVRPAECVAADPNYPYCQLWGSRLIPLPTWRVNFYPHMDETCPSLPTAYARPAGC